MPIQLGDTGTQLILKVREGGRRMDLRAATTTRLVLTKPDGNVLVRDASFLTDGADGSLLYVTGPGEIDQAGLWHVQAELEVGGWSGRTNRAGLLVES
jgi:hypothetical protein